LLVPLTFGAGARSNPGCRIGYGAKLISRRTSGIAELIRDKAAFQQRWTSDLDNWFDKGVDTPGIVLIKVKATRATYWKGREEGEVDL
jgi:general stress protein 26